MKQGVHGDRYIPVTCEVDALEHKADDLGTEVNRNGEPVADSTGMIFHRPIHLALRCGSDYSRRLRQRKTYYLPVDKL